MIYQFYRVSDQNKIVVFEFIYDDENATYATYDTNTWEFDSLLKYFEEEGFIVEIYEFTTAQLYNVLKTDILKDQYDYWCS